MIQTNSIRTKQEQCNNDDDEQQHDDDDHSKDTIKKRHDVSIVAIDDNDNNNGNHQNDDNDKGTKRKRKNHDDDIDIDDTKELLCCCFCSEQSAAIVVTKISDDDDNNERQKHSARENKDNLSNSSRRRQQQRLPKKSRLSSITDNNITNNNNKHSTTEKSCHTTIHSHYCLLHYYTTNIMIQQQQQNSSLSYNVDIYNHIEYHKQLPYIQSIFHNAFIQLQQEIEVVTMESYNNNNTRNTKTKIIHNMNNDPLSILTEWNHSIKMKTKKNKLHVPKPSTLKSSSLSHHNNDGVVDNDTGLGGGFIRNIPLPERFLKKQKQQHQQHQEYIEQIKKQKNDITTDEIIPTTSTTKWNTTRRRPKPQKSIWNSIIDDNINNATKQSNKNIVTNQSITTTTTTTTNNTNNIDNDIELIEDKVCTSCHTIGNVMLLHNNTSRKCHDGTNVGETWGNKDRDNEIYNRYHCYHCNKVWNE